MGVTVEIESANFYSIQKAIKMLRLLPDVIIKVSEEEYTPIPNAETCRAMKSVKSRKDLVYCDDINDFWKKIDA